MAQLRVGHIEKLQLSPHQLLANARCPWGLEGPQPPRPGCKPGTGNCCHVGGPCAAAALGSHLVVWQHEDQIWSAPPVRCKITSWSRVCSASGGLPNRCQIALTLFFCTPDLGPGKLSVRSAANIHFFAKWGLMRPPMPGVLHQRAHLLSHRAHVQAYCLAIRRMEPISMAQTIPLIFRLAGTCCVIPVLGVASV